MEPHTESQFATTPEKRRDWLLPASILIAAVLVSGALVYNVGKKPADVQPPIVQQPSASLPGPDKMPPVTADDHVLGDLKSASVVVVTYTDLECPFCKRFHPVVRQAVAAYQGKVAWVYRNWPIAQLHPKAPKEAEAAECAAELGGNDGYWKFVDRVFEVTPGNNGLDPAKLPEIAATTGLNRASFDACLSSGKYAAKVEGQANDAQNAGGEGTPYSVVTTKGGRVSTIPGAFPLSAAAPGEPSVKAILDEALK